MRAVIAQLFGVPRADHGAREGPRDRFDVGGKRRVERPVKGRVVANYVNHGNLSAARVVQIGQGIGKAWP